MVTNNRSVTGTSGDAGTSQVQTEIPIAESSQAGTLRLRATSANQNHVQWADDVVDNEGMGKKSSKGKTAVLYELCYCRIMVIDNIISSVLHIPQAPPCR